MKTLVKTSITILCLFAFVSSLTTAQDLQEKLKTLGHDAALGYVTPFLSGMGNDLNSAIYYSADLHDFLGFDVGVKIAMSRFVDADKTFNLHIPSISIDPTQLGINSVTVGTQTITIPAGTSKINLTSGTNYPSSIVANTAVGSKDPVKMYAYTGTSATITSSNSLLNNRTIALPAAVAQNPLLELPGGFDLASTGVPMVMPQFDLGFLFGLEFMLRYVPTITAGDAGKFNYMGFGVRYDIDQWIPLFPIDIAVHFMTQKMNFKSTTDADIFSAKATAYGLEISKRLLILTLYAGFQLENSTLTLADFQGHDPVLGDVTIPGFEVKGSDKSRFTVGARLLLLIINAHIEYSIAKNPVIAIGAGISLR